MEYIQKHYLFLHAWKRGTQSSLVHRFLHKRVCVRVFPSWTDTLYSTCCAVQISFMLPSTRLYTRCLQSWLSYIQPPSSFLVCCGGVYYGEALLPVLTYTMQTNLYTCHQLHQSFALLVSQHNIILNLTRGLPVMQQVWRVCDKQQQPNRLRDCTHFFGSHRADHR